MSLFGSALSATALLATTQAQRDSSSLARVSVPSRHAAETGPPTCSNCQSSSKGAAGCAVARAGVAVPPGAVALDGVVTTLGVVSSCASGWTFRKSTMRPPLNQFEDYLPGSLI